MAKTIKDLNVGSNTLDPKTQFIKFEGDNETLLWRTSGRIMNAKAEIIVPETHCAVYIKDGVMQNILEGGRHPVFETKKVLFFTKKNDAVDIDLVFLSKTCKLRVLWGTRSPIKLRDDITEIPVTVRANGEFSVNVATPRQFYLELVGADKNFTLQSLKERLATRLLSYIEPVIASFMKNEKLSYVDISANKRKMSDAILPEVANLFLADYGLKVFDFTIADVSIADEEIRAIEDELAYRREEIKDKKNAKEIADELERLKDKEWEREIYLRNLEMADKDKYYEVLKILGWPNGKPNGGLGVFCPNCGNQVGPTMAFCPNCGKPVGNGKKHCPKCGAENENTSSFCCKCGTKL